MMQLFYIFYTLAVLSQRCDFIYM